MYYDRTISNSFANELSKEGSLYEIYKFVKSNETLDFQIGRNNGCKNGWISIYLGLTRVLKITQYQRGKQCGSFSFSADKKYLSMQPQLYGYKDKTQDFQNEIELLKKLLEDIKKDDSLKKHYQNQKEGFYQSILSRKYGINSTHDREFVIIDKEAVIGYKNTNEKDNQFNPIQYKYKNLLKNNIQTDDNKKIYGTYKEKTSLGGELDFIAIDKDGNILLIEYKHGENTKGIYLSPIQIGLYYELFTNLDKDGDLKDTLTNMIIQKQKMGLISKGWKVPDKFKKIIPILLISNKYSQVAQKNFKDILSLLRTKENYYLKDIQIWNFTEENGIKVLSDWNIY